MLRGVILSLPALLVSGKKQCPEGTFHTKNTGVANLCEKHFPEKNSDKVWLVMFYAPWCGHCKAMKPAMEQLATALKDNAGIGIGGVNCDAEVNKPLCGRHGVQGFPTMKTIVNGKAKNYQGGREMQPMKQHIEGVLAKKGTSGGSAKCPKGMFKSAVKDSVVPLCDKHFPDQKSKFSWVLTYYNKDALPISRKEELNRVAEALGNEPADRSKAKRKNKKQKELVADFVERYEIKGDLVKKGKGTRDPLVKFGGICCDCEAEVTKEKCAGKEGLEKKEVIEIYNHETKKTVAYQGEAEEFSVQHFAPHLFTTLGYVKPGKEEL